MSEVIKKETIKETILDIAIEMILIALVFLVPVVFDRRVGIVFSLTKVTFMRLLIIAIITIWTAKVLLNAEHKFPRSPLDWPVASYMLACTIACVTSVHVLVSFIGFYGRYEGLTTLWMYGLLYFLMINFIRRRDQIRRILYTMIVAGICMSIYSMLQRAGLDPYAWGGVVTWQRVIGTIGQPNFLAAYVDMAFVVGLGILIDVNIVGDDKDRMTQLIRRIVNVTVISGLVLIYTCILFTQSRGGFLGLFCGISLFLTLMNKELLIAHWKKFALLFFGVFIVSFFTIINPAVSPIGRISYEAERIQESHEQETPVVTYSAALSRLETWKSGYRIMGAYPLFGIGEEVMKMIFPQFETEYFRFYEGFHVKQDRMHNEICDVGATRGIITLVLYVWLLGTFFWLGSRIIRSKRDEDTKVLTCALLGAAMAYLIQNQFSFGVVAITSPFWIIIGLVASIYIGEPEVERTELTFDVSRFPWLYATITLLCALTIGYYAVTQFRADIYYKSGTMYSQAKKFDVAVSELQKSLSISPYEGGTWTHLGISSLNLAQTSRRKDLLERSIAVFEQATRIDPYNADIFYILGRAYMIKSVYDENAFKKISGLEDKAIMIDPRYAEAFQLKAMVYEKEGNLDRAFEMYKRSLEINPGLEEGTSGMLNIATKKGGYDAVIKIFNESLKKYPNNLSYLEGLAMAYVRMNNIDKAISTYSKMVEVSPTHTRAIINLGFLYARQGMIDKAKGMFEQAVMIDPKSVDAHNGLGSVYLSMKNLERAREEYNQTLTIDPNNQYAKDMLNQIK